MPDRDFSVSRFIFLPPGVFIARLHGMNRFQHSMSNAHKLCERFEAGDFGGLVIDYSDCTLGHQPQEYRQVANIFAEGMPQGLPFAFVYRRDQLAHILVITRTLNMSGLKARGFDDTADAEHWVFTQIGADRSAAGEPRMLGPMDEDQ